MSALTYHKNHQSMMDKETIDTLGFSADIRAGKVYRKIRTSRDGSCTVEYRAPLPLGDREMKVAFTLATQCLDDDGRHITSLDGTSVSTTANLREMAKFIYGNTKLEYRKSIFEALFRIKGLSLMFTYDDKIKPLIEKRRPVITGWIHEAVATPDYETADVVMSKIFLKYILLNPISFNLEKMVSFKGRACFLYMTMQGFKYKLKTKGDSARYAYYNYIPNEMLVQGLDLVGCKPKVQMSEIRKAFRTIGLDYTYNKRRDDWVKNDKRLSK